MRAVLYPIFVLHAAMIIMLLLHPEHHVTHRATYSSILTCQQRKSTSTCIQSQDARADKVPVVSSCCGCSGGETVQAYSARL